MPPGSYLTCKSQRLDTLSSSSAMIYLSPSRVSRTGVPPRYFDQCDFDESPRRLRNLIVEELRVDVEFERPLKPRANGSFVFL